MSHIGRRSLLTGLAAASISAHLPKPRVVSLDYETYSEAALVGPQSVGLWNYSRHLSTQVLMVSWRFDDGPYQFADLTCEPFPEELREALLDPNVIKWAFNAGFERVITRNCLGILTPYKGWRCTMALANLMSFSGDLLTVGAAMGIEADKLKDKEGARLIKLFCGPHKGSRKSSLWRHTSETDPEDWEKFCTYNMQDVVAETEIRDKLQRFELPDSEWETYEIDQRINDRGMPINRRFIEQADMLVSVRQRELFMLMRKLTGLDNPNSTPQLLPWLQERGYPFGDLQKATVLKVLTAHKLDKIMTSEGAKALRLRQQLSRTSVKKFPALLRRASVDDRIQHAFQFAGAARTARWAGRGPQPQNLTRTPKVMEIDDAGDAGRLIEVARVIETGNYSDLKLLVEEPMTALAGSVRSSFQAPEGYHFTVCDLSAIESAVIAWLSRCERLLDVFRTGRDPYLDFGVELFGVPYEQITRAMRSICKPAVLGCGYQLGGGMLREGKRTGLWGYAEAMGVEITKEEAHRQVALFREIYPELPTFWANLETAARSALMGRPMTVGGLIRFAMDGPFLTARLPSGRKMYYYKPRVIDREFEREDGTKYTRRVMSYMGMAQMSHRWGRVSTSGGKQAENVVQATARDILALGMRRAHAEGFPIVGSVHDEIISLTRIGDNRRTLERLNRCMTDEIIWASGLPLKAAGYVHPIYRKDS